MTSTIQELGEWSRTSVTVKLFAVGILILVLLIPTAMINSMVRERQNRRDEAVREISSSWAGPQMIRGPILSIPYRRTIRGRSETPQVVTETAHFVPTTLEIGGQAETESRRRGIYRASVYTSSLTIRGTFPAPSFEGLEADTILWDQAFVSVGFGDLRGVKEALSVSWNGTELSLEPGAEQFKSTSHSHNSDQTDSVSYTRRAFGADGPRRLSQERASMVAKVALNPGATGVARFEMPVQLRGSESLSFIPVGRKTQVQLSSSWTDPSFKGAFLPDQRTVSQSGFDAAWTVHYMNRNLPDRWIDSGPDLGESAFGVEFMFPVDHYSNTLRSTKYAVLFIFLTFLVFFFVEFFNKKRMHPIQYLLVGGALTIFYLLLLSLSEHMPFVLAYVVATTAVVALIGGYAHGVFERTRVTSTVATTLVLLYGFLYTLLQLEDYALLIGSIGLFAALAVVMYLTRKIDWYKN